MPWILETYNAGVFAATYNVIDPSKAIVTADLLKLNDAKVICASTTPIDVDQEVKVCDNVVDPVTKVVIEKHELLHGFVQKYAQITKGVTTNTYEYTIKEYAVELEKYRVHDSGGSYTVNCGSQTTTQYVNTINYGTSWTVAGGVVDQTIAALQFRYMTGIAALNKIIANLTAAGAGTPIYMWFDSAAKTVGWGEYRNDRTGTNITKGIYYNYKEEKTIRNQVSGVVIYGANSAHSGQWPASPAGHDLAVYQYDDATTDQECQDIAKAVYLTWCADPKRRIQFCIRPADTKVGGNYVLEGDRIKVDNVNYTIIDMTHTPKEVLIGVNAGEDSALYSLGDKLKPVAGTASGASEIVWAPGTEAVANDYTKTLFPLEISNVANIQGTVMMNVTIGPYKVYSYPEPTYTQTNALSTVNTNVNYWGMLAQTYIKHGNNIYLPMNGAGYLVSDPNDNGFNYAIASIHTTLINEFANNGNGAYIYIICCYSYDGVTWHEGTYQQRITMSMAQVIGSVTIPHIANIGCQYIIPGVTYTCQVYTKWRLYCYGTSGTGYGIYDTSVSLDIIPRHAHLVTSIGQPEGYVKTGQTANLQSANVTPPSQVVCTVNNGTPFNVSNNTPVNITSKLITGHNTIEFSSGTVCTVTPSSTYQMFGG